MSKTTHSTKDSRTSSSKSRAAESAGPATSGSQQNASVSKSSKSNVQPSSFVVSQPGSAAPVQSKVLKPEPLEPRLLEWRNFFLDSGIPEHAAQEYASIFVKERINWATLRSLDRGFLADMGINCIGDQLAILQAAKRYSGEQYAPTQRVASSVHAMGDMQASGDASASTLPQRTVTVEKDTGKMEICSPVVPVSQRLSGRKPNDGPSPVVRSVIKAVGNPSESGMVIRAKRPVTDDADIKEQYMLKKMSTGAPRQVRVVQNADALSDVEFRVHVGSGNVNRKADVFSRLTPKGAKSSPNAALVRVLENKMQGLTTAAPVEKPTLVSDRMQEVPVKARLGLNADSSKPEPAGNSRNQRERPTTAPSSVFSRLGFRGAPARAMDDDFVRPGRTAAGRPLSIRDRLG